jgi:general secretion pathway protein K
MKRARRQHGFALVLVLWSLAFLSLLGTALVTTGRQETQRLRNMLDSAVAEAAAEGALHQAIFALLDSSERRWVPGSGPHVLRFGSYPIELRIEDESGKVNPNIASTELLQALLVQVGASLPQAASLAAAIADWRDPAPEPGLQRARAAAYAAAGRSYAPPGEPFETLDEVGAVLGMTPDLLARLRPHLTLYTAVDPASSTTDPVVAAALGERMRTPQHSNAVQRPRAATVVILLRDGLGRTVVSRRIVVRINLLDKLRPYQILSREAVPAPPG